MARIEVIADALGGLGQVLEGVNTPLEVSRELGLSTSNMLIYINDEAGTLGQQLHDKDILSFQLNKVTSGN